MLDISVVRSRAPHFRGQSDIHEPAPVPSAPPSSPPRTRRHVRRLVYRWHRLFHEVYKINEQRRLVSILNEHVQRYKKSWLGALEWRARGEQGIFGVASYFGAEESLCSSCTCVGPCKKHGECFREVHEDFVRHLEVSEYLWAHCGWSLGVPWCESLFVRESRV